MQRILVVRNDKIGDFMLAWPSFAMLKASCDCHVTALVPPYTAALAELCPWIDQVILDPGAKASRAEQVALLRRLRQGQFDAAIALFSRWRTAWLLWRAGIPYRLAPATKLAQFLYNHRLVQRRSRSEKPESQYNLDLIRHFLQQRNQAQVEPKPPYLAFDNELLVAVRGDTAGQLGINPAKPWLMVHCGTGGSANNLRLEQYATLILGLQQHYPDYPCVLTAGPGEGEMAAALETLVQQGGGHASIYHSREGLPRFCQVIANAALFIAGSTGPLHIAAALDVPTVGFFPARRSATPLRWRPLNSEGRHLAIAAPTVGDGQNMHLIPMTETLPRVYAWFAALQPAAE